MKYSTSIFVKCQQNEVVAVLQKIAGLEFDYNDGQFQSTMAMFSFEISATPEAVLHGASAMKELGIPGDFFEGFDFTGFETMVDIGCTCPDFASSLLPLSDCFARMISQKVDTPCVLVDDDGSQVICKIDNGLVTQTFPLSEEYLEGVCWHPNLNRENNIGGN